MLLKDFNIVTAPNNGLMKYRSLASGKTSADHTVTITVQ